MIGAVPLEPRPNIHPGRWRFKDAQGRCVRIIEVSRALYTQISSLPTPNAMLSTVEGLLPRQSDTIIGFLWVWGLGLEKSNIVAMVFLTRFLV